MPRVGDVFQLLSGTLAVPNTTIQSAPYNAQQQDWVLEANTPRPISAGGTGATTGTAARVNLGAIGAGDLAAAATKTPLVDTDSIVIIDSEDLVSTAKNKRWLVSDFRTSLATMTNTNFTLVSTDGTSNPAPYLDLDRRSPTAATNDNLGIIRWLGRNSAENETVVYGQMYAQITDHINNQEKSNINIDQMINGTSTRALTFNQAGATFRASISTSGNVYGADFYSSRAGSPTHGVYHFGDQSGGSRYLLYDGSSYQLVGASLTVGSNITAAGNVVANSTVFTSPGATILQSADGNNVFLRCNSSGTFDAYLRASDGFFIAPTLYATTSISTPGTLTVTGTITSSGSITGAELRTNLNVYSTGTSLYLSTTGAGTIALRPNGSGSPTGQTTITSDGDMHVAGNIVSVVGRFLSSTTNLIAAPASQGIIYLRPGGENDVAGGQVYFNATNAYKAGGGSWAAGSDERIKTVKGSYDTGLDAILALEPVRFTYNGNDGAPDTEPTVNTREYIGLVAQAAEGPMPELVTKEAGYIDGEAVTDFRTLDTTPLFFAFINAFKQLTQRVRALEEEALA